MAITGRLGLFVVWIASRAVFVLIYAGVVDAPVGGVFDDVALYHRWSDALLDGRIPIEDPMWQYPPGAAALFAAIRYVAGDSAGRSRRHSSAWRSGRICSSCSPSPGSPAAAGCFSVPGPGLSLSRRSTCWPTRGTTSSPPSRPSSRSPRWRGVPPSRAPPRPSARWSRCGRRCC
ncbi:hypothetical protein [Phytohabitans flavus]|uniref:hypothetical protein n=1 Tax=Phytohabitans flavus TaxID=1076124 RepID=UPI001563C066|nr:hypothetical protein [Phytohabitans flavus]